MTQNHQSRAKRVMGAKSWIAIVFVASIVGCSNSVGEIKSLRSSQGMPPEARQKMTDAFAAQNSKVASEQAQWRKEHPAEAAKMDEDRAKAGLPPIGK